MINTARGSCQTPGFSAIALPALCVGIASASGVTHPAEPPTQQTRTLDGWRDLVGDTNGDGLVNALDLAGAGGPRDPARAPRGTGPERLVVEVSQGGVPTIPAGESLTLLVRIENSTTPLFGYSLGVSLEPMPGTGGVVTIDADQAGFYPAQNLFIAAGLELDPLFSVILDDGAGVFINANTAGGSTVLAVPDVNDILAEVTIEADADALGEFAVDLSEITVLADGAGLAVPFDYDPLIIEITIAPCSGADLAKPYQILDLEDLLEFIILFGNEDPRVDYAAPVGLFDLQDILTFVGFFLAGC